MALSQNKPVLFKFKRRRLVAEPRPMGKKDVYLKQELFLEGSSPFQKKEILQTTLLQNLPASSSNHRTLTDILELSEKENLHQYNVEEVTSTWPVGAKLVKYSRCADNYTELLQQMFIHQEEISTLKEKVQVLENEVWVLKGEKKETESLMTQWQVVSLTLTALDSFFWARFSEEHISALRGHGISTYAQLYNAARNYLDETEKRLVAHAVFNTIDEDHRDIGIAFLERKQELSRARTRIAHPKIKNSALLSFLALFFPAEDKIKPVQKILFENLKKTANSIENTKHARAAQQ